MPNRDADAEDVLFEGRRMTVVRRSVVDESGATHVREVIRHPGSVAIVPVLDDGRICLIRNRREAVGATLIEIPAGTREAGEEPEQTATRELIEETGYRAGKLNQVGVLYPSPGILDERMVLYIAEGLEPGQMDLDPGERIEPFLVGLDEALAMIRDGRIVDAKTVVGLLRLVQERSTARLVSSDR